MHEEYLRPVGFAKEPAEVRKRWILRIITIVLVLFIAWLLVTKVISTPETPSVPSAPAQSQLPAPG